jgi:hypothetical protein
VSTFDQYVESTIGKRPPFTKGNYGAECRSWDAKYIQLLNGGIDESLPIYHPKRRKNPIANESELANVAA